MLIGIMFINLDLRYGGMPCGYIEEAILELYTDGEITIEEYGEMLLEEIKLEDKYDVQCVVLGEIYEPFIYLFYALFVVFMILGFMEKKE